MTDDSDNQANAPLLALIAHDLRQPIQAMLLSAHLLSDTPDSAAQARARTLESQLIVLQRMLDLSCELALLESGARTPNLRIVSSHAILQAASENLGGLAKMDVNGSNIPISAEPSLLQMMIEGLVFNAQKCGLRGAATVRCDSTGASWSATCEYEGKPFTPAHRQAFFIEMAPRTEDEPPVALGLAFIERLCLAMGGRLCLSLPVAGRIRAQLVFDGKSAL